MSGFIILNDGRAWTASNGAFDAVIEALAEELQRYNSGNDLAIWLLEQRSGVKGPGLGSIDIRELTQPNQQLLLNAIEQIADAAELPKPLDSWSAKVRLLARMVASYRRGEPPMALNPDMKDIVPSTGKHSGPGWE